MLPTDKEQRKARPMARGLLDYFPDALAEVSNVSFIGNKQHNPGEEMHWNRRKSLDHADCIMRHLADRGKIDSDGMRHSAKVAWRALALLQIELEEELGPWQDDAVNLDNLARAMASVVWENHQPTYNGIPITYVDSIPTDEMYLLDTNGGISKIEAAGLLPPKRLPRVYIAGPMRGYKDFNFPAFDKARDDFNATGEWEAISPADMDRSADAPLNDDAEITPEMCRKYMGRDLDVIKSLRAEDGEAIAMLPGWEGSTGAVAEFMAARWGGIKILDARSGEPLHYMNEGNLARSISNYLEFHNPADA